MTGMRGLSFAIVLTGCVDYEINPQKDGATPDSAPLTGSPTDTAATEVPCVLSTPLPEGAPVDESCLSEPEFGTLDAIVEWESGPFSDYPEYSQVVMTPVVGQLTDDDGDGDIDADDTPDIVVIADDGGVNSSDDHGTIRILAGDTGTVLRTIFVVQYSDMQVFPYRYSNAALGDIDGDGRPEIVAIASIVGGPPAEDTGGGTTPGTDKMPPDTASDTDSGGGDDSGGGSEVDIRPPPPEEGMGGCYPAAWRPDGTVMWLAQEASVSCSGHAPALADLEGDGQVEVLVGATVLDGRDGSPIWAGTSGEARYQAYDEVGDQSFAMDMNGDGIQEVLAGRTVYAATGAELCSIDMALDDGFPAAADLDGDGAGEFVLVGNGTAHVHDGDCTLLASWDLVGQGNGGPPTIGDFDADGFPEIGVAEASTYSVYEVDGTVLWSVPTTDQSSHATGSSVFDFDGDGRAEVVYGDEVALWIFDGATGAVRLQDTLHTSRTLHEYAPVVDVDGDGLPEIVVPQGGGHHGEVRMGVYVLGSQDSNWVGSRMVWNQHAYSINNIEDDLSIPAPARPNWPEYNTFRSGDLAPLSGGSAPDAVAWGAVCETPCVGGILEIAIGVGNGGTSPMRAGVPVSVYAEVGGERVFLGSKATLELLDPGDASSLLYLPLDVRDIPEGTLWIVADDANGVQQVVECHEDNNESRLDGVRCD